MAIARRILLLAVVLSLLISVMSCQSKGPTATEPGVTQSTSIDPASIPLPKALSSSKPTLAEFGSSTCIPCKQMKPILEDLAIVYEGKLNVVIVEVYEQEDLTQMYGIMAIPTQIVFDSNGKEVTRHMGLC
ncbi:MAG: thioredoxin family protein, partial [Chloroflexota bacterium]